MDPVVLRNVRDMGRDLLLGQLKELGVAPRIGKTKLAFSGMFYGQAGLLLRLLQTDLVPRDRLEGPDLLGVTNRWPYSDYVR